jgi:hypothetical protein
MKFEHHYTRDQARALLPKIRDWLKRLVELRDAIEQYDLRLTELMGSGKDVGGTIVNSWVRSLVEVKEVLNQFNQRDIQIKDLERGLIDFPAVIEGKEVFLCWESDEDDIGFWHDLDAGFAGREPLPGEEI